jgi:hypothetical protein
MLKACHDAGGSKRDAQKIRGRKINTLEVTGCKEWSTFGHRCHLFGHCLSKKGISFLTCRGKNLQKKCLIIVYTITGFTSVRSVITYGRQQVLE